MNATKIGATPEESPLSSRAESSPSEASHYILRLYVTGKTPNSVRAISSVREVCEECLPGRYQLQVIDIYQQPSLAEKDNIQMAPTLVRREPGPLRRLIGNLADRDRILAGLELQVAGG